MVRVINDKTKNQQEILQFNNVNDMMICAAWLYNQGVPVVTDTKKARLWIWKKLGESHAMD